jgi:deazaflavin-dependent oxidoreductase (nitroreductase family)
MNAFNDQVIAEFRANKGIVGGHFAGVRLLLLHDVSSRTGTVNTIPLLVMRDGESFVVVGSAGGAKKEPAWVTNLEAASEATVEFGAEELSTRPVVIREQTPERERLYAKLVDYWPDFLEYEKTTDRLFPVIRLDPVA